MGLTTEMSWCLEPSSMPRYTTPISIATSIASTVTDMSSKLSLPFCHPNTVGNIKSVPQPTDRKEGKNVQE